MLARIYSLKGQENFKKVKEKGKTYQSDSFGVAYLKRKDNKNSLFGFVVSKKISKHAIQRNRIRRAMSEAVRYLLTRMKNGYDVVFLAKPLSVKKSTDEIMKEVDKSISHLKLLK